MNKYKFFAGIICLALIFSLSGCDFSAKNDETGENGEISQLPDEQEKEDNADNSDNSEDLDDNPFFIRIDQSKETNIFPPQQPDTMLTEETDEEPEDTEKP